VVKGNQTTSAATLNKKKMVRRKKRAAAVQERQERRGLCKGATHFRKHERWLCDGWTQDKGRGTGGPEVRDKKITSAISRIGACDQKPRST